MIQSIINLAVPAVFEHFDMHSQRADATSSPNVWAPVRDQVVVGQKSFDQVLSGVATDAVNKLQEAEMFSMRKTLGEDVAIRDVVDSIMEAERVLTTSIAIRDKIVQSYLEISRMQI
ncbi:MAG: flagellar hook-basal body complex protein FliE [Candidatus Tokpelaia sp. JSC188]|nr:MAG: flagellar hook-basal body complex protein FliE [Candidatus Tokpelaia sp. JSC188]